MHMRRLRQALIAVIVPAALVGLTVGPAEAAKPPKIPAPEKVVAVYPHLAGVTPSVVSGGAQPSACTPAKLVKGAKSSAAVYSAPASAAATPSVTVSAVRFKTAAKAKKFLSKAVAILTCESSELGFTATVNKFSFKLKGTDQRLGMDTQLSMSGITIAGKTLLARKDNKLISVSATSGDAAAPAVEPAQALLKVAVKTAR